MGSPWAMSFMNWAKSSLKYLAPWVQAAMQRPQAMQVSALMLTKEPLPLLQIFTGHAAMHAWQLTHLSCRT